MTTRIDVPKSTTIIDRASEILACAFQDEPLTDWIVKEGAGMQERKRLFFRQVLGRLADEDLIFISENDTGAAVWVAPDRWRLGFPDQLSLFPGLLPVTGGAIRLFQRLYGINKLEKVHPIQSHYYLLFIGVIPEQKNRGIGSSLLERGLDLARQSNMPAYLETPTEENVNLYGKFGFRIKERIPLPFSGPMMRTMWKEAE